MIDLTGSMAGLLDEIVGNLAAIARGVGPAIKEEFGDDIELDFKYGVLGYRDYGDQRQREVIPITADVNSFISEVHVDCLVLLVLPSFSAP